MHEKLLNDEISTRLQVFFESRFIYPVELIYFSSQDQCYACNKTEQL